MDGVIKIEDLQIHCTIGSQSYEKGADLELFLDLEFTVDFTECVQTDSIADTIDYKKVAALCQELATSRRYHLVETFAYEALHDILKTFSVRHAKIRVKKTASLPHVRCTVIELEKDAED